MRSITIRTTQNVAIEYELAGSMSRVFAFLIDSLIISVGYFVFLAIFVQFSRIDANWPWQVMSFFLPLTIFLVYYFCCELLMQGQTIGKRVQNLQVVRADGRDPTPGDHLLRTLFLLPDAWFTAGVPALLLINTTPIGQRLGDMVANTVVIRTQGSRSFELDDILGIQSRNNYEPRFPSVQQFTEEDMLLIKQALSRAQLYQNEAHRTALQRLAEICREKLAIGEETKDMRDDEMLRTLLQDYIVLTR